MVADTDEILAEKWISRPRYGMELAGWDLLLFLGIWPDVVTLGSLCVRNLDDNPSATGMNITPNCSADQCHP
jgi:hypothetical protein